MGSKKSGYNEDFFLVKKGDLKYVVRFLYFEKEKTRALPMFTEVLKSIRYIDRK